MIRPTFTVPCACAENGATSVATSQHRPARIDFRMIVSSLKVALGFYGHSATGAAERKCLAPVFLLRRLMVRGRYARGAGAHPALFAPTSSHPTASRISPAPCARLRG